jgi:hypothetical protein
LRKSGRVGAFNVPSRLPPFVCSCDNVFTRAHCALARLATAMRVRESLPTITNIEEMQRWEQDEKNGAMRARETESGAAE